MKNQNKNDLPEVVQAVFGLMMIIGTGVVCYKLGYEFGRRLIN